MGELDIDWRAIANGLGVRPLGVERLWEARPQGSVASVVGARERNELDLMARDPGQRARVRPQQADGAGYDRVEHRLDIRLRAADDAQDVAGGRLRVQRRRQLTVARLELGEQAHVLDRDHGLVGEGLEEVCLTENGPASARATAIAPMGLPSRSIGTTRMLR